MGKLPKIMKVFLAVIYLTTVMLIINLSNMGMLSNLIKVNILDVITFCVIIALAESFPFNYKTLSFSTTFAITIAIYLNLGVVWTIVFTVIGFLFKFQKIERKTKYEHIFNVPWYGTLFNICSLIFPVVCGNYFYVFLGGEFINHRQNYDIYSSLLPIIVFSLVFFVVNLFIISILISLMSKQKLFKCVYKNFQIVIINYLFMVPLGLILAIIYNQFSFIGISVAIFPVLLVRYTFSLYARSKDQYEQTIDAFALAVEARDPYTEGHSRRVSEMSVEIAKELKFRESKLEKLKMAALLHDIGKIGIRDNILNKPGQLDNEEFEIIREHPLIGYNILSKIKDLEYVSMITMNHHERYDGKGYPNRKNGNELPIDVFIVQFADSVDAMITDRPYRKGLNQSEMIAQIHLYKGSQFHPKVVEIYLEILKRKGIKVD